jgi:predicted dehydrogenase
MRTIAGDRASFGELLSLHGMFAIGSRTGWDDEWFIKTGGIHYVDLVRYLFGEVTEVRGFRNSRGIQVDQLFTMRFEDGRIGSLFFAGLPAWVRHHEELTVTGVSGFVRVENMVRVIYHIDRPAGPDRGPHVWLGWPERSLPQRLRGRSPPLRGLRATWNGTRPLCRRQREDDGTVRPDHPRHHLMSRVPPSGLS